MSDFSIEYDCDGESALSCGRQISMICVSSFVLIFSIFCIFKIYRHYSTFISFELLTLVFPTIQAIIQIIFNVMAKLVRIDLTAFMVQLLSYTVLTFGLVEVYYAISLTSLKRKKIIRIIFSVFIFAAVLVYILALCNIPVYDCYHRFSFSWDFLVGYQILVFSVCMYYGIKMINKIKRMQIRQESSNDYDDFDDKMKIDDDLLEIINEQNENSQELTDQDIEDDRFQKQKFYDERIKQIKLVIIIFSISMCVNVLWNMMPEIILNKHILCTSAQTFSTKNDTSSEIDLIIQTLFYLVPSIAIPYIFYIRPIRTGTEQKQGKNNKNDLKFTTSFQRKGNSRFTSLAGSKMHWSFTADDFVNVAKFSFQSNSTYNSQFIQNSKFQQKK